MHGSLDIKPEGEELYDERRWNVLKEKRDRGVMILEILVREGINGFIYGSVARGDVREESDIDVVILDCSLPPSLIEEVLASEIGDPYYREIVQASPRSVPKYHIHFDEELVISIPLGVVKMKEREFYKFGGRIGLDGLKKGIRVPGVNKGLKLIYPTPSGHFLLPVIGYESAVAKILEIDESSVRERIAVLTKRKTIGKTGLYAYYRLMPEESVEEALSRLRGVKKWVDERLRREGF
ncbi:MAG: nucleotidyltransferase domain-containing protein [Candidatus Korarchaeum sp.]|nr:nucleotidyltransferase domain-containing protein [Candidatus Korarchaeum sp.]MDW8035986.1 nucleotidyltransferase domain-containing protein [Candidatus Korarchaeum sp.]